MFGQWQKNYSYNKIEKIITNSTEDINFGIILGDVIDLEGDCVESNKILEAFKIFKKRCTYDDACFGARDYI